MQSQILQNTFCTYTGDEDEVDTTIFFISGNPGLISYYHPFLSLLAKNLEGKEEANPNSKTSFRIYGCSLGGFEIGGHLSSPTANGSGHGNGNGTDEKDCQKSPRLYDLEEQICFVQGKLNELMQTASAASGPEKRQKVIIMGHSVGTYMAMEILRRHREASTESKSSGANDGPDFDIVGGIMLFPTVMDISASPSGQKLTTLLSIIPQFALVVSLFARLLTFILPNSVLKGVVRTVMRNPPPHALDTTFNFLKSPGGVRQALHMAADEMRSITTDKWTDDVWGVSSTNDPVAKLFFYFGRNDHWVAEKTRDEIIAVKGTRGKDGLQGPQMFVCEEGLPHAFCLKHNEIMAQKVARMIGEIVSS